MIENNTLVNSSNNDVDTIVNKINCTRWEDGIKKVSNNSIDLVITDPPYGMSFRSNMRKDKYDYIQNDDNLDWLSDWIEELYRVCKKDAHLYIFCSWHNIDIFKQKVSNRFNIKNILIWEKNHGGMGDLEGDYSPKYEMILFCSNGDKKLNGRRDENIIKSKVTNNKYHPTEKPVSLIKYFVKKSSKENDIVLDTFAGSFTTAVACKQINRNFICFELDETYCNNGKKRLKNLFSNADYVNKYFS